MIYAVLKRAGEAMIDLRCRLTSARYVFRFRVMQLPTASGTRIVSASSSAIAVVNLAEARRENAMISGNCRSAQIMMISFVSRM
jgi:hypothetical protein